MNRRRRSLALLAVATLVSPLLPAGPQPVRATSEGETTFLVLATDASSVDSAIAAAQAAGGTVQHVNRDIGLVTVSSNSTTFVAAVSADPMSPGSPATR